MLNLHLNPILKSNLILNILIAAEVIYFLTDESVGWNMSAFACALFRILGVF